MPNCTITRTHRCGKKLQERDRDPPVSGPIHMVCTKHPTLNRWIDCLSIERMGRFGGDEASPIPDLWEPKLLTFGSSVAMMIGGFEEIDGQRYYQGWYIRWE